jgi:integrase/recombinase XerD
VDYSAAVDRYLTAADLGSASRRVYRISLHGWAWPLVDRRAPTGRERRGAHPPLAPLALLDDPRAPQRLQRGLADRAAGAQPRTLARELACLRAATTWWQARGWITADPAAALAAPPQRPGPAPNPPGDSVAASAAAAGPDRARAALTLQAPLRELTLWYLLHESGAPVERVLALDIDCLDLPGRRTRAGTAPPLSWGSGTAHLLPMLLVGRPAGPVFITTRRAPATTPAADHCPVTGRGRLSYRRAAELFTAATRPLDPSGHGWTLLSLRERTPRARPTRSLAAERGW